MKTNPLICILALVTSSIVSAQDGVPVDPAVEAVRLSNNGQHAESIECIKSALLGDPGNEKLKYRLAGELVFDHRPSEARAYLQELSRSWNVDMASMAANSLATLDRLEEAEKKARARPSSPEAFRQQAEYQARKERLERQQKVFDLIAAQRMTMPSRRLTSWRYWVTPIRRCGSRRPMRFPDSPAMTRR